MMHARGAARRRGQHFLVDPRAVRRIVAALDPQPGEAVLEIGAGRGALTGPLIAAAGRIAAVEVDPSLGVLLRRRFDESRLLLVVADILRVDLSDLADRLRAGGRWVVAGNLPYGISKPVAALLVRERARIERAVLMFQREVAERLTAAPGGRRYGPLGILVSCAYRVERLFDLPGSAFRPRPEVVSTVTRWQSRADGTFDDDAEQALRRCLAACFARRRRTLRNNLVAALRSPRRADELLEKAGLDGSLRAEAIAPKEFRRLAKLWPRP